jgi:hypothetical protein
MFPGKVGNVIGRSGTLDSMDLALGTDPSKAERAPFWDGANLVDSSVGDWVRTQNGPVPN